MKKLFVTLLFAGFISLVPSSLLSLISSSLHPLFSSSLLAQIPSDGLVAWYPFNGNANDESGNGNDGTVNGATLTSDRFGNANGAYSFNGVNNRISDNSTQNIPTGSNARSVSCWFLINGSFNLNSLGSNLNGAGSLIEFGMFSNTNRFGILLTPTNSPYCVTNNNDFASIVNISQGSWHHIILQAQGSLCNFYLDGNLVSSGSLAQEINTSQGQLSIGNTIIDPSGQNEAFNGIIDDICIYNRLLSSTEIQQLYQDQTGQLQQTTTCLPAYVPTNGLVGFWPFCGNANDESGNGNDGAVNGATLYTDRFGNQNGAYSFNGIGDYIFCGEHNQLSYSNANKISLSFWFKSSSTSSNNSDPFDLRSMNNNSIQVYLNGPNANGIQLNNWNHLDWCGSSEQSTMDFIENQWQHLVEVVDFDNNTMTLYFNGQLTETIHYPGCAQLGRLTNPKLNIGSRFDMYGSRCCFFQGLMDDFGLWNRAITSQEIQALYLSGQAPCTPVSNSISATIIQDQSYTLGTQTLTTAGTYTEVFTSAAGCDSTVTLTLAVEPLLTCNITTPTTTLCAGQSATLTMNTTGGAGSSSQLPANLQQGLVAYYPFNGNANDESGNGNNGVVNGATLTSDRFGNIGSAYYFNGTGAYIKSASYGFPSNNRTINVWMFPESSEARIVCGYGGSGICGNSYLLNLNMFSCQGPGKITMQSHCCANVSSTDYSYILPNQWNMMTYTQNSDGIRWYINGNQVFFQISNFDTFVSQNSDFGIGTGVDYSGNAPYFDGNANPFHGWLDDIVVYNRSLSPAEVQQLYTSQSYAWSTNATTPTITVSPTTNTTYSCTVTSGTQTCTGSVDITVNPLQSFYADADGDGYGNPNVVVSNCNPPTGYVTDNTDCNDNNAAVFSASTETCNGLDDDCDGQVDEGLTIAAVNATSVTTALYPTCSGNALKSANLNNGTNSDLIEGNGLDLWYSLTAQYNTLRASLSAAFGDNEIRLYSYNNGCFELLETEHEVYAASTLATGNQILISDDLIPGQTYYIAVHNISGNINPSAKMCFNLFVGTTCDHYYSNYTGIYNNVCTSFKAQYKGNATNYIFDILSATQNNANLNITPWSYTTTTANSVVPRLGTLFPVNMSASAKVYTLRIPVIYAIPDAAGNYTSITANATTTCTVTLNAELPVALRAVDRCPNTKNTTSSISIDRTICGALRYEWEFTQQLPSVQPAVTVLGGLNTTVFFLNNVPGMGTGKTYNVRVRPIHTNGEVGSWGTVQCLKTGTAGMVMQSENAEAWANNGTVEWANNYSPELEGRYTLYPNPTSNGRFTLTASNTSDEEVKDIKMMDITGKMVYKTQVVMNGNAVEIELGNLASGVYVVIVGEERLRLVVQ